MLVKEIIKTLESLAPRGLASSWDNVGLQVGLVDWQADRILLTLDVTPAVISYAIQEKYDLIISHHPFIFKPINAVTRPDILELIAHRIAVIAMHTNLDVVSGGVNTALAEALGLQKLTFLSHETGSSWFHGSVTVPESHLDNLAEAVQQAGAGRIGLYDRCSTRHAVTGTYRSLEGSTPYLGHTGSQETVVETELEFMVDSFHLNAVKQAIKAHHPYETPAVYFVQTENPNPGYGLGLIGELAAEMSLGDFTLAVKSSLHAPYVQLWTAGTDESLMVKKIAVCGGAGGSLISRATGQADVLVTGDINYHAMLDSRIPLVNAGHFYTEYPALKLLQSYLQDRQIEAAVFPMSEHEVMHNVLL